ncbi:hypothetical protein OA07_25815 [Aphanizomenon flos-aquae 2012/KM1/D3]|nr:hypothetical protein OA07_25815 [Aphanizomenon flos-aquae 2012/KM1/D3]
MFAQRAVGIIKSALLIKGMNFSLTQRRKDAKVRVLKVQFGNFIPQFSNAIKSYFYSATPIISMLKLKERQQ